ncbi:MAG: TIGR02221 family CRISPR-associated protein [Bacteroidales bacterium]|jgi:CRISPR-associated Csx2 family protein|nr:TIGR02221 family CRISPR-associated protein [Bacteroidales bacterium]
MARKVFVSFLGMGGQNGYTPVVYKRNGQNTAQKREFVQTAILELYPHEDIDRIILLTTKESEDKHKQKLKEELNMIGVDKSKYVEISNVSSDLTMLDAAWEWFGQLQSFIEKDDTIILDVTHGFRIIPVVFSAAIGYLKRAKNVFVESVLYGVFEAKEEEKPIVDVKDFYTINDWAEGVGRLIDDADASFLKKVAQKETGAGFAGLNNDQLLRHIENLTKAVRNIELQKIENNAKVALGEVQKSMVNAKPLEKQILEMIVEKFTPLISEPPTNGKYSKEYLSLQIRLIELLAQHGLYMQCFTAMREWLGSLGVAILGDYSLISKKTDERARRYADIFVRMLQYKQEDWTFDNNIDESRMKDKLRPSYIAIDTALSGIDAIQDLLTKMTKVRNGFDHGWTGKHISGVPENISETFKNAKDTLLLIIDNWDGILNHFNQMNQSSDKC